MPLSHDLSGEGWQSGAWSDFGELIALALSTRKSELFTNTGGGIQRSRTWSLRTFVRVYRRTRTVELVFFDTKEEHSMQGSQQERDLDQIVPRVDNKYG